jgi:AcrR family transcriptional regulator
MALGREARRANARQEILRACWDLAAQHGLSGFTVRQVAAAVGVQAPSLYSYFASKNAMYDAMFKEGSEAFASAMAAVPSSDHPRDRLRSAARAYLAFCTEDPVRHQLLFQRTLPGFEPSADAYAPALEAYQHMRGALAEIGIIGQRRLDLWTALLAGVAAQQLANDPGGRRWTRLVNEAADMFLGHVGMRR